MERPMNKAKLPKTNSIQELADFWDRESVFERAVIINVPLDSCQVKAVEQMAQAKGVSREELVRAWVLQKLARWNNSRSTKQ
jgi:hypothetical protein